MWRLGANGDLGRLDADGSSSWSVGGKTRSPAAERVPAEVIEGSRRPGVRTARSWRPRPVVGEVVRRRRGPALRSVSRSRARRRSSIRGRSCPLRFLDAIPLNPLASRDSRPPTELVAEQAAVVALSSCHASRGTGRRAVRYTLGHDSARERARASDTALRSVEIDPDETFGNWVESLGAVQLARALASCSAACSGDATFRHRRSLARAALLPQILSRRLRASSRTRLRCTAGDRYRGPSAAAGQRRHARAVWSCSRRCRHGEGSARSSSARRALRRAARHRQTYVRKASFLAGADAFDAAFLRLRPRRWADPNTVAARSLVGGAGYAGAIARVARSSHVLPFSGSTYPSGDGLGVSAIIALRTRLPFLTLRCPALSVDPRGSSSLVALPRRRSLGSGSADRRRGGRHRDASPAPFGGLRSSRSSPGWSQQSFDAR